MPKSRAPMFAAVAIVAILLGVMSARFMHATNQPVIALSSGTLLPARELPDFQLLDSKAQAFLPAQLQGHWSVLFFGYTSCPDVCPTTLSTLAQVETQLSDLNVHQRPQMVFISVDPQRDTPAQVGNYVQFFSKSFIGVTGKPQQLETLTSKLGVPVAVHTATEGNYTVDHAATLFLVDPQARVTAIFSPPYTVSALSTDLRAVVSQWK